MTRARHEHQIKLLEHMSGNRSFEDALMTVLLSRNRFYDLDRLPDDLVADVRALMIRRDWTRHKFRREQRKQALANKERDA